MATIKRNPQKPESDSTACNRLFHIFFKDTDGSHYEAVLDPDEASSLRDRLDEALNTTGP